MEEEAADAEAALWLAVREPAATDAAKEAVLRAKKAGVDSDTVGVAEAKLKEHQQSVSSAEAELNSAWMSGDLDRIDDAIVKAHAAGVDSTKFDVRLKAVDERRAAAAGTACPFWF